MAKHNWNEITKDDVIKAIEAFDSENPEHPEPRSTFLLYEGRKYPAKHIRGMAYQIHHGREISKEEYAGGQETVRFFNRLGFETQYTHRNIDTHPVKSTKKNTLTGQVKKENNPTPKEEPMNKQKPPLKIGLYLQTDELYGNRQIFNDAMDVVRKSDIDILVLPEFSYVPYDDEYRDADFLSDECVNHLYDKTLDLSRSIGRAVVVCNQDKFGTIMSIYANAFAGDDETECKDYIKHTMTQYSACDIEAYPDYANETFQPIIYRGHRIGLTICYDCNHAIFSRKYGLAGVDIILNSTGGNVVFDKWHKFNKARAIENECFTFVTMGGNGNKENPNNYVFGFTPQGKEMKPSLLNGTYNGKRNVSGGIYVYDTAEDDGKAEIDSSLGQTENPNKKCDIAIPTEAVMDFVKQGRRLKDNLYVMNVGGNNLIMCLVDGADIMKPEKVLKLLYAKELKDISNKRYLIVNRWEKIDLDYYNTKLSLICKVRAMENYCAVVLSANNIQKAFQCGNNRTAQVVKAENGKFGIDLSRTGGPETIWKNKQGMKASWRKNIEWLIETM